MLRLYAKSYTDKDVADLKKCIVAAKEVAPDCTTSPVTHDLCSLLDFVETLEYMMKEGVCPR